MAEVIFRLIKQPRNVLNHRILLLGSKIKIIYIPKLLNKACEGSPSFNVLIFVFIKVSSACCQINSSFNGAASFNGENILMS